MEGFDTTTLDGWTVKDGAQVGTGAESRYAVKEGALVLRVGADDQRFKALLRTVPLGGATSIRVRARMRTEGVDPAPARFDLLADRCPGSIPSPRQNGDGISP